jgi:large subunit ribosomal protein L12e
MGNIMPKVGPRGVSGRTVKTRIEETISETPNRMMIECKITTTTRQFELCEVETTSSKILKYLEPAIDKSAYNAEREPIKYVMGRKFNRLPPFIAHNGSLSLSIVVNLARDNLQQNKSKAKSLTAAVMEVLGTCLSIGCKVNGKDPRTVQTQIREGELVVEDYLDETLYNKRKP